MPPKKNCSKKPTEKATKPSTTAAPKTTSKGKAGGKKRAATKLPTSAQPFKKRMSARLAASASCKKGPYPVPNQSPPPSPSPANNVLTFSKLASNATDQQGFPPLESQLSPPIEDALLTQEAIPVTSPPPPPPPLPKTSLPSKPSKSSFPSSHASDVPGDYHVCKEGDLEILKEAAESIGVGKVKAMLSSVKDGNMLETVIYLQAIVDPIRNRLVSTNRLAFDDKEDQVPQELKCQFCPKVFSSNFLGWFPWFHCPIIMNYDWNKSLCTLHLTSAITSENAKIAKGVLKKEERIHRSEIVDSQGKLKNFDTYVTKALNLFKDQLNNHYSTKHPTLKNIWPLMALKSHERKLVKLSASKGGPVDFAQILEKGPTQQFPDRIFNPLTDPDSKPASKPNQEHKEDDNFNGTVQM